MAVLALKPVAQLFLECSGHGIARHDENTPPTTLWIDRDLARYLQFTHLSIFVQHPRSEFDLPLRRRAGESR